MDSRLTLLVVAVGVLSFVYLNGQANGQARSTIVVEQRKADAPLSDGSDVLHPELHLEELHHQVGYLTPEHAMGNRQSPINILTSRAREEPHQAEMRYKRSKEHVWNLGETIEVDWDAGSQITFDGGTYELIQFHFHTPSEHLLDGITYPMEIHLVHRELGNPDRLLVVGALFKEGAQSPIIEAILPYVPTKPGQRIDASRELDVNELFQQDDGYYYYSGSLTTPPYSEVVSWLVLDGVHEASAEQVEKIARIEGYNARHIQDPHARAVAHCQFTTRPSAKPKSPNDH